jgi:hypothetical protein
VRIPECGVRLVERRNLRQVRRSSIRKRDLAPWRANSTFDQGGSSTGTKIGAPSGKLETASIATMLANRTSRLKQIHFA